MTTEADRERNRSEMPGAAAWLDALRAAGLTPAWFRLTEGERTAEWGRRTDDRDVPAIPGVRKCR